MSENRYFEIKYPMTRAGAKKRWIRIGSATEYTGESGPAIACTIDTVPINWDGVFHLFPAEKRAKNDEARSDKKDPTSG